MAVTALFTGTSSRPKVATALRPTLDCFDVGKRRSDRDGLSAPSSIALTTAEAGWHPSRTVMARSLRSAARRLRDRGADAPVSRRSRSATFVRQLIHCAKLLMTDYA